MQLRTRGAAVATALLLLGLGARAQAQPACTFNPGDLPAATLPPGTPHGAQIPVNHIVVLMQENRSFDHYFGQLGRAGQPNSEIAPKTAENPNPLGGAPIKPFHQTRACELADLGHSWNETHEEWNGGAMDGFTEANVDPSDPTGARTMGYYRPGDLNYYFKLYKTFAMGDRYFSSTLSQTFPNRFYLIAGTSFGHIRNDFGSFPQPTIFGQLEAAGISWKIYNSQFSVSQIDFAEVQAHPANVVPVAQYYTDAAAGTLPQVAFIEPFYIGKVNVENDEHPSSNVQVGQQFVAGVVDALMKSPNWGDSALFLTYDEHGGFWDHVPPPKACIPDAIPPILQPGDIPGQFDNYGIRVPAVVVSPFARAKFVSHSVHDHTSILRFIQTRFDLPALTKRDANADPMLEFFDFANPPFATPPRLPKPVVNKGKFNRCAAEHP